MDSGATRRPTIGADRGVERHAQTYKYPTWSAGDVDGEYENDPCVWGSGPVRITELVALLVATHTE